MLTLRLVRSNVKKNIVSLNLLKMKKFEVYHSLKEFNSFVNDLKDENFLEFTFEDTKEDGEYVLFSFLEKKGERIHKLLMTMKEIPLSYLCSPFVDKAIFTVLCFAHKYKLEEIEIYGQCNIKINSSNKGYYHNDVIISPVINNDDPVFPPDFNSINEVFKLIKNVTFNNIKVETPLMIINSTDYTWSFKSLLHRFGFIEI